MLHDWLPRGSLRRIVAGNTLSQLIGRIISSIAVVVVSLLIAKRYGPEGYGDFVKITTYVSFFYLIADFGLNAVYLQRTANDEKISTPSVGNHWRLLLGLRLAMSFVLVLVALIILSLLPPGLSQGYTALVRLGIVILIPVIFAQAVTTTTNAFFQKILRYDLSTVAQNAGSFAMLVVAVSLSYWTSISGSFLGVISVISGSVVTALLALKLVRGHLGSILPKISSSAFVSYLRDGTPLGLALIFNLLYFHSDSVVLTLTRTTREVGIYGLAYKVFELPLVVPIFFMNAVYPLLLKNSKRQGVQDRNIFMRSLQFLLFSSIVLAVGIWLTAPLVTLVRPDFADSIAPLRILILGLPIFFVSALFMWFLIARKMQRVLLVVHGIVMVGNIVGNAIFIPRYGMSAAAWITIVSEFFVLVSTAIIALVKYKQSMKA